MNENIKTIRIESENDRLFLKDDFIHVIADNKEDVFPLSSIKKMYILTTDSGPLGDDMSLAVDIGNNTIIYMMSEHNCFKPFLFDQIGKLLSIDYQKIVDASMCIENGEFEIYSC